MSPTSPLTESKVRGVTSLMRFSISSVWSLEVVVMFRVWVAVRWVFWLWTWQSEGEVEGRILWADG